MSSRAVFGGIFTVKCIMRKQVRMFYFKRCRYGFAIDKGSRYCSGLAVRGLRSNVLFCDIPGNFRLDCPFHIFICRFYRRNILSTRFVFSIAIHIPAWIVRVIQINLAVLGFRRKYCSCRYCIYRPGRIRQFLIKHPGTCQLCSIRSAEISIYSGIAGFPVNFVVGDGETATPNIITFNHTLFIFSEPISIWIRPHLIHISIRICYISPVYSGVSWGIHLHPYMVNVLPIINCLSIICRIVASSSISISGSYIEKSLTFFKMEHGTAIDPYIIVICQHFRWIYKCSIAYRSGCRDIKFADNLSLILFRKHMETIFSVIRMSSHNRFINGFITFIYLNFHRYFCLVAVKPCCCSCNTMFANRPFLTISIPCNIYLLRIVCDIGIRCHLLWQNRIIALNNIDGWRSLNRSQLNLFIDKRYLVICCRSIIARYHHIAYLRLAGICLIFIFLPIFCKGLFLIQNIISISWTHRHVQNLVILNLITLFIHILHRCICRSRCINH